MNRECFIKVRVGPEEKACGRERLKPTDLCCPEHWKLVPAELRRALVAAGKLRKLPERQRATILAADKVADYLAAQLIQLPPVEKVVREQKKIISPERVVRSTDDRLISGDSKLILPGR